MHFSTAFLVAVAALGAHQVVGAALEPGAAMEIRAAETATDPCLWCRYFQ